MAERVAVVVTSIAAPNPALRALAAGCRRHGWDFIVIGDAKSPTGFQLDGCRYFDLAAQRGLGLSLAAHCPTGHYARKNLGYLAAIRGGADRIVETDDDNHPLDGFWVDRERRQIAATVEFQGWVNAYRLFSDQTVWPRGLPLDAVHDAPPLFEQLPTMACDCPIQQELADDNPDVDAVYRLLMTLPISFLGGRAVALATGAWCPFNSQSTVWWRDAFPLLYLPAGCSFRMTDIWRSFVAQAALWKHGYRLSFHRATMRQFRNDHDLMRDFADEIPGYLENDRIAAALRRASGESAAGDLPATARRFWQSLIDLEVVPKKELEVVDLWLDCLRSVAA